MHVGFEAKRFFTNFTGLGNYARFVVNALSEFEPENSYTLYSPKVKLHPEINTIVAKPNINTVSPNGIEKIFPGLWRSYGLSKNQSVKSLDVFHGLSHELPFGLPTKVKKVVTVHDLIFLRYPEYYSAIDVAIYRSKVQSACDRADLIIAISEQTKSDIEIFLGVDARKIKVIYQGCHPNFKRRSSPTEKELIRKKYGLPQKFILNVGTIEPRKNLRMLVEALAMMPEEARLPLVVIGRATKYKNEVLQVANTLGVSNQLCFTDGISFADLPLIYQLADLFVYPSQFEGFGIPLVEAIESGVPVITSSGSCFIEAAGPTSLYSDPYDPNSLATNIRNVLTQPDLRRNMIAGSLAYVRKFDPSVIARDLMNAYAELSS
jgi:glycosyltransferase involved in cell wall biosynthesis